MFCNSLEFRGMWKARREISVSGVHYPCAFSVVHSNLCSSAHYFYYFSLYLSYSYTLLSPFTSVCLPPYYCLVSFLPCVSLSVSRLICSYQLPSPFFQFTSMATPNESSNAFEEVVPPSASSSKPRKRVPCDVFINHRGPDTKHTLATSVYRTLKSMGLEVFLDEPELELGDFIPSEIQDAMTTSFLHIAILSPTYADSPWCLAELSFMLKTGNTIIPVFYKVDPGNIRWTAKGKGVYTDAFSKHKESGRYSSEKLQDWKVALQNVTFLTGHIVKENE